MRNQLSKVILTHLESTSLFPSVHSPSEFDDPVNDNNNANRALGALSWTSFFWNRNWWNRYSETLTVVSQTTNSSLRNSSLQGSYGSVVTQKMTKKTWMQVWISYILPVSSQANHLYLLDFGKWKKDCNTYSCTRFLSTKKLNLLNLLSKFV